MPTAVPCIGPECSRLARYSNLGFCSAHYAPELLTEDGHAR